MRDFIGTMIVCAGVFVAGLGTMMRLMGRYFEKGGSSTNG